MASNQKQQMHRFIEAGKRTYSYGIFTATGHGNRQLTGIIDGNRQDAEAFMRAPLTVSGRTRKGFKRTA